MDSNRVLAGIFPVSKPIIGMVHLRPLPGAPLYDPCRMNMEAVIQTAVEEALQLEAAGVDGLQIENIWDYPYLKGQSVGHETTAALAVAAREVKNAVQIPIGINCHLNAGLQALSALDFATAAAALSTTVAGAQTSIPSLVRVEELVKRERVS